MRTSPQDPGWAAQQNEEEVLLWSEELGVNMWQSVSVSNSPLTHNQHQPFRNSFENKVWEVYFLKKRVRSFIEIRILCWLCFRVYLYMHMYMVVTIQHFEYPVRWQKLLGSARSGSTALSYRNCVITLVGGWWGQSIARAFTRWMMNIYIYIYIYIWICVYVYLFELIYVCVTAQWQLQDWYMWK